MDISNSSTALFILATVLSVPIVRSLPEFHSNLHSNISNCCILCVAVVLETNRLRELGAWATWDHVTKIGDEANRRFSPELER